MKKNHLIEWGTPLAAATFILMLGLFTTGCGGGGSDPAPTSTPGGNATIVPSHSISIDGQLWTEQAINIGSNYLNTGATDWVTGAPLIAGTAYMKVGANTYTIEMENIPVSGTVNVSDPVQVDFLLTPNPAPQVWLSVAGFGFQDPINAADLVHSGVSGTVTTANDGVNLTYTLNAVYTAPDGQHTITGDIVVPMPQ